MSALHLACASEGARYVHHTAAMLHSALVRHRPGEVHVHYLHGPDMTRRQRAGLQRMVERLGGSISFIFIPDSRVAGLPTKDFTRKATWYRIFLPELAPNAERAIYLDSDLVVLGDLNELWKTELDGFYLAAVTNVLEPMYAHRPAELGVEPSSYFNAGVLVFNLAEMRKEGCAEELRRFGVKEAPRLLWRDQDTLNVVLGARRVALHPRWNHMNIMKFPWALDVFGADALEEARRSPGIRHFEGPDANKPWHLLCERSGRRLYLEHRLRTPWPLFVPDGFTARNAVAAARWAARNRRAR